MNLAGDIHALLHGPAAAQRRALAQAITLMESTRADHRAQAQALLATLMPHTGRAFRLGLSGVPGVGKSTLIETLGLWLIGQGHRVAVLAVDPSSSLSGGSILGDKTRMQGLAVQEQAFIRPSPSGGTLGGVAEHTREALLACEAAGYDVVIVETVGVGQSEAAVAGMTDAFVLMQLPHAGDELQAFKRGVMELADCVLINKADIDPAAATHAQAHIESAWRAIRAHASEAPAVLQLSAQTGDGVPQVWAWAQQWRQQQTASGAWARRRQKQALAWMWERVDAQLKRELHDDAGVRQRLPELQQAVAEGRLTPVAAATELLQARTGKT